MTTSGSEIEGERDSKILGTTINGSKTDEMNDSGHSSVASPEATEGFSQDEKPAEKLVKVTIQPTVGEPFDLHLNDSELVQELYQTLLDREATCHRTCFTLSLNGQTIDNYSEVRSVPGFTDGCTLVVVDEPFTVREARLHLRQVRELLKFGLNPDPHDPPCSLDSAQAFLPSINLQPEANEKKDAKPVDVLPPDYALPGSKDRSLSHLLVPQQKPLVAVKNITISPFNPPPGPRKMRGDIMYFDIYTVENRTVHVTCSTKGFYVNNSHDGKFDPIQSNAFKTIYHSIVELLQVVSAGFKKTWPLIMKKRLDKSLVERLPTSYPTASWVAQPYRADGYGQDSLRAQELTEPFRVGFEDHMPGLLRDWNEELQTTFEMPRKSFSERAVRDRSYFKIHSDFVCAAVKGAQSVIDGNILAINPGDERKTHMYIWNNIFFSLGFDVKDHYKELGGDAAAFAATSADLQGVRAISTLDDPTLHTLGMAIFDYRGYRVTAQSIIPGILEREQEQSVVYGSIDFGKTVVSDERYHELLESVAKQLKWVPHTVISTKDGVDKEIKLYTSYETKGIIGNDGRKYVLDLLRTMPPDVHFLEDAEVSESAKASGYPRQFPHKLAALRRELIDQFCEKKLIEFIQHTARHIRGEITAAKEKNDQEREKLALEAEGELAQVFADISDDREVTSQNSIVKEAIGKACVALHSLHDDKFEIKFNPDCFSSHVRHAPGENLEKQRNLNIEAADFVLTHQIPDFAIGLKECIYLPMDGEGLCESLHQKGINIRYLGELAKKIDTSSSFGRPLVLSELIARSLKHIVRKVNNQTPAEQLATSTSHILNCLFGNVHGDALPTVAPAANKKGNKKTGKKRSGGAWSTLSTQSLWKSITEEAASYYGYPIKEDNLEKFVESHDIQKTALLRRVSRMMGIQIVGRDYQLDNSLQKKVVFGEDDIINFYPVIKHHQPYTADAKKMYIRGQHAMSVGAPREAYEYIAESINMMTAVYGVMHPDMPQSLRALARLSHVLNDTADALNHQHKATIMSERLIGLDCGETVIEYISLAHFAFAALLIPGSLRPLYRARYLLNVIFGEKHPIMSQIDANIGTILFTIHEYDTALKYLQSSDQISKAVGEPRKLKTGLVTNLIARTHAARGDFRAALVVEKETFSIFSELYGPNHQRTRESSEYLKTLTHQAVTFQKKMMDSSNKTSISELFHIQTPSVSAIFEVLNIINGILIIGIPGLQSLQAAEKLQNGNSEEENKTAIASQLETETLD